MEVLKVDEWLLVEKAKFLTPNDVKGGSGVSIWSQWTTIVNVPAPVLTVTDLVSQGLISITPTTDGRNTKNR